ncbi:hypothetical protein [Paenarthrobacter sp. YJN-5]|uniref:hypothetical protein n=1 Tax=Paenarthrobacter sp. YJN-5 TaxID=2735316 RepID=UPI001877539A|nr:hypothetical protein [Paenarthrobacter sp. YJN-5]QOT19409.1 hypothetical protein HMI59_22410 [Paenarthrobacter sp. YJN-5]
MSTKIYNGYRLTEGTDPFEFVARLRTVMDPARDSADAKLLASLYVRAIDSPWFRGEPIQEGAGYAAWREWRKEQDSMGKMDRRHDPNEFGVEIGLDEVTGRHLLLLISYNRDLTDAFTEIDGIEEYGYWNNTDDYPDGVTEADWEERKAAWNRVIPRGGYTNLLTFNLRPAYDGGVRRLLGIDGEDTSSVFASVPTDAARARDAGGNAYMSYLCREHSIDVMDAVNFVGFGRSARLSLVIDVAAAYLPEITPELVKEGSHSAVIDPAYAEAMRTACEELYELDKERLHR